MNAIRQGLAMSLTLLAVYYAYMRKKIKYITVCLLASFIHYTAFCFIPFLSSSQHKVKENSYCRHLSLMRTVINESNIQYFYGYGFNVFGG